MGLEPDVATVGAEALPAAAGLPLAAGAALPLAGGLEAEAATGGAGTSLYVPSALGMIGLGPQSVGCGLGQSRPAEAEVGRWCDIELATTTNFA